MTRLMHSSAVRYSLYTGITIDSFISVREF